MIYLIIVCFRTEIWWRCWWYNGD